MMVLKSLIGSGQLIVIFRHPMKAIDGSKADGKTRLWIHQARSRETAVGAKLEGVRSENWNLRLNRKEFIKMNDLSITWNLMSSKFQ